MNEIIENTDLQPKELPTKWGWLLALGILMVILGTVGIFMSVWVTLATVLVFGGFALAGGIFQLIQGFKAKEEKWLGRLPHFLIALIYILMGIVIIIDPLAAGIGITLAIAALLAAIGITRIVYALKCRKQKWRWVLPLVIGIIDLILAVVIVINWPISGLWVIGLFVSIEMIMNGWFLVGLAFVAKDLEKRINDREGLSENG